MTKYTFFLAFLFASPVALACDLDDCVLPNHLHDVEHAEDSAAAPADDWSWMNHDLALARSALHTGQRADAIRIIDDLDQAMRAKLGPLTETRGQGAILMLHAALQDVLELASGLPLQPLQTTTTNKSVEPLSKVSEKHASES